MVYMINLLPYMPFLMLQMNIHEPIYDILSDTQHSQSVMFKAIHYIYSYNFLS